MSIVLPDAMVDYYEILNILESCEDLPDDLREALMKRINQQPWYEGMRVDEDDDISNVFLVKEHNA